MADTSDTKKIVAIYEYVGAILSVIRTFGFVVAIYYLDRIVVIQDSSGSPVPDLVRPLILFVSANVAVRLVNILLIPIHLIVLAAELLPLGTHGMQRLEHEMEATKRRFKERIGHEFKDRAWKPMAYALNLVLMILILHGANYMLVLMATCVAGGILFYRTRLSTKHYFEKGKQTGWF